MTDRELMQQALDALQELNKLSVGENAICLPAEIDTAMDSLRARLAQHEPVLVSPKEFIAAVTGKWDITGIPVVMSVWPMQEWGDSQVTNPEFVAEQKAMNEALRSMVQPEPEQEQSYKDKPCIEDDGCPTEKAVLQRFWRKYQQPEPEPLEWCKHIRRCSIRCSNCPEPLWVRNEDGKLELHASPQREWQGLTEKEQADIAIECGARSVDWLDFATAIESKLREKNA